MNVQMCLVLVLHFLPRMKCHTKFFVTIESNVRHTMYPTNHGDVLPQNVELNLTSCTSLHHFTFLLTLRENSDWTIPIFTQNGQQTRTFIKQMPENVGMYAGNRSVFILKTKHEKIEYCMGSFERHGYTYTVYTLQSNISMSQFIMHQYNTVLRTSMQRAPETVRFATQSHNEVPYNQHPLKMPPLDVEILKTASRRHRQSRQIQLYEIELLIVVDFSLFTQMSKNVLRFHSTTGQNIKTEEMVHEIMMIVHGIDVRFRNIKGDNYMVDVVLAGIFIAQNSSASPWSESVMKPSASRPVVNEDSLKLFIEWTKIYQHILPDFDHAMAITAYNLRNKDNHKTIGLGYKQSMCTDRRYSIIEHHGNTAYVSYIATHELAHSLGAKHDGHPVTVSYGEKTKSCQDDAGFIMGTTASSNPDVLERSWQFSECSQLYFDFFIDHLNENRTNCMTSSNHQTVTSDPNVSIATRYTADEQCERTHGQGFVLDRVAVHSDPSDICRSLPCKNVIANIRINTLPLAGTRCGVDKICDLGKCVEDMLHTGIQSMEAEDCIFGDQPGSLRTDGLTCQHLKVQESAHECYTFTRECCDTCKFHLRKYTNIPNCEYGDRKASCSARDCDGDMCCETCSLLQGLLTECLPQILNENVEVVYNTISPNHGTSAMFSCQKSDFILTGNQTSVCLDGTWSSTSPHCVSGCRKPILKDFAHAHLYFPEHPEQSDTVDPMSVMHFQCMNGFVLKGPLVVVCLPESTWNDSFPTCALEFSSLSTVDVLENINPGEAIHTLSTGNVSSYFKLLYFSHPGLIVTRDGHVLVDDVYVIDYEHTRSYTMIVEATSVIEPRFKTKQRLTIKVQDINEFSPEFSEDNICIEMILPLSSDPLKRRVHATDLDLYSNITYGLERSLDYAVIDHVTGEITVSRANFLKQPDWSSLVFEVYAVDSGVPTLTGTSTIEISFGQPCARNNIASDHTPYLVLCNCFTATVTILSFHFCFIRSTFNNG